MGTLRHQRSRQRIALDAEAIVGRSAHSSLKLRGEHVSLVHASIRFSRQGWEIKDLSSTNGTFVNGARLEAGQARVVVQGDRIAFGAIADSFEVVDVAPPRVSVVADGGVVLSTDTELLAIPEAEKPLVTLYRSASGGWKIERDGCVAPIQDAETFEAAGKIWSLRLADVVPSTNYFRSSDVRKSAFLFTVSADEEHVEVSVRVDDTFVKLGNRVHNYLLLTLARRRMSEEKQGLADPGWFYQEELAKALSCEPGNVSVEVFRIRRRFLPHFCNAAEVIERRAGNGQLRLSVSELEIARIE